MKMFAAFGSALLVTFTLAMPASAQEVKKQSNPHDDLGAQWWQLAMSLPSAVNPFFDPTKCGVGQRGKTWFLYSTALPLETVGEPLDVPCTLPVKKRIFLQLTSAFCTPEEGDTIPSLREECAQGMTNPGLLRLEIDGVDRADLIERLNSKFTLPVAADNIFAPDFAPGVYTSVHDGYYALLPPLPAGDHTVLAQALITLDNGRPVAFSTRHVLHIVEADSILRPLDELRATGSSGSMRMGR
jgi:hypothetical protein